MLIENIGTQYVEGELSFAPGFQIYLYDSVFSETGDYILFDYSLGSFPGGQSQLNSNVSVVNVDLKLSRLNPAGGISVLEDQPDNKRIVLKLLSKLDNGKQWIEGDLNFSGPTTVVLSEKLYVTSGAYELFEVTGNIIGFSNLTVVHAAGYFTVTPFIDPNNNKIIKVNLSRAIGLNSIKVSKTFALPVDLVQSLKIINISTAQTVLSNVQNIEIISNINIESTFVQATLNNIFIKSQIKPDCTSIKCISFDPSVECSILLQNAETVVAKCFSVHTETPMSSATAYSSVYSPGLSPTLVAGTTTVTSNAFRLRSTMGESYWYNYFPMACFQGEISLNSDFKIRLLSNTEEFNPTDRYLSDISTSENDIEENITLKNVYINNIGEAIYDFDSVTFQNLTFSFQNAVIYANDILVMQINWARPFELNGQSIKIEIPQTNALARPVSGFGTLDLQPYIKTPAKAYATAYSPLFPYLYPQASFSYARAFSSERVRPENTFSYANAYTPDSIGDEIIVEAEPGPDLIELSEEDFTYVYAIAFDPIAKNEIRLDSTFIQAQVFETAGPVTKLYPVATSVLSADICSPILHQTQLIIPQPEDPIIGLEIKCADPFYETRSLKDPKQKSSISDLLGYWNLNGKLKDGSYYRNNLQFVSVDSNANSERYDNGLFGEGFRGFTYKEETLKSDYLVANKKYSSEEDFSIQIWFKIDNDEVLLSKNVSIIEQMDLCWSGDSPSFPGSQGWSLHSVCDNETISFQFNIIDAKARFCAIASLAIGDQFTISQKWHHVVGTRRGDKINIYVDGIKFGDNEGQRILEGEYTSDYRFVHPEGAQLRVGSSQVSSLSSLLTSYSTENLQVGQFVKNDAVVDEIAIWKKYLTDDDVQFLWLGGNGNPASELPAPNYSIDTKRIDHLRQGVELTSEIYFRQGNYKIYSGDRKNHRWQKNIFGLSPSRDAECFNGFKDTPRYNSYDYVTNTTRGLSGIADDLLTDGVITAFRETTVAEIVLDISRTFFMISEYPILPFKDGFTESQITPIKPFDDDVSSLPNLSGYIPYEWRSQSTGYDYNANNSPGTDSIAFGGLNY